MKSSNTRTFGFWLVLIGLTLVSTVCLAQTPRSGEPGPVDGSSDSAPGERFGFAVEFGAVVIERSMALRVDADTIEHQPRPYVGAYVASSLELADFDELDAALVLDGEFGYGFARNSAVSAELGREPITQFSTGGARLGIDRRLSEQVSLFVGLGSHVTSFIVEANASYTGHRYVAGEAAVALKWLGASVPIAAELELAALPVLSLNQSSGGYGDGRAFGGRAEGGIGWNFLERDVESGYAGGRLMLRYRYQRFRSLFPERRISLGGGASVDQQHGLLLTVGYFL
ncbi:MAG: hypothetical protein ACQEVA_19380 [Myxococcota bacterium]